MTNCFTRTNDFTKTDFFSKTVYFSDSDFFISKFSKSFYLTGDDQITKSSTLLANSFSFIITSHFSTIESSFPSSQSTNENEKSTEIYISIDSNTEQTNIKNIGSFSISSNIHYETIETNELNVLPYSPKKGGVNIIVIIGIVCGLLAAILITIFVIFIFIKKKKTKDDNEEEDKRNITKDTPTTETQSFKHTTEQQFDVEDDDRDINFWI